MPFEENANVEGGISPESGTQQKQRRQMHIALALLLTALVVVVVKDRQFWLGSAPATTEDSADETTPDQTAASDAVDQTAPQATSAPHSSKAKSRSDHTAAASIPAASGPTIVASNRAALPPLEIEVVAGGQHQTVQPTNHSVKVDLQADADSPSAAGSASQTNSMAAGGANLATNAGERVRLSPDTAQMVERPVEPNYPMLAKQMKVQGSVVLQALIGREGAIQDLRVLSGPVILSTAAMDAVRQWRFRPYFEAGQAVETEARITVNFTISTY
jgi:TonB family protein